MFRRLSVLAVAVLAIPFIPAPAEAQNPRLSLSVEGRRTSSCVNKRVGSVVTYYESPELRPTKEILNYGFVEEPLNFACSPSTGFLARAGYRVSANTSLEVSVSKNSSSNAFTRSVTSEPGTATWIQVTGWGDPNLTPVRNHLEGGLSPIRFHADDEQRWFELDLRAVRAVNNSGTYRLSVSGGIKYTRFNYRFQTGETQTAQEFLNSTLSYVNFITLESNAVSNTSMLGPQVGVSVARTLGPVVLEASANGALLKSTTALKARFDDTDEVTLLTKEEAHPAQPFYELLYKGLATYESSQSKWVSNANLRFEASKNISLVRIGLGAEMSYWNGATTAPFFIDPWNLGSSSKAPTGVRWDPQSRNIARTSLFLSAGVRF